MNHLLSSYMIQYLQPSRGRIPSPHLQDELFTIKLYDALVMILYSTFPAANSSLLTVLGTAEFISCVPSLHSN